MCELYMIRIIELLINRSIQTFLPLKQQKLQKRGPTFNHDKSVTSVNIDNTNILHTDHALEIVFHD